jgi:hypothetical protein
VQGRGLYAPPLRLPGVVTQPQAVLDTVYAYV